MRVHHRLLRHRVAIFSILALTMSVSALSQGTNDLLPDPITTTTIINYSKQLGLDESQRSAFLELHEAYLQKFFNLRETRVNRFLEDYLKVPFREMPGLLPKLKTLDDALDDHESILNSMISLDHRFFDGLSPSLTEHQLAALEPVRLRRERDCYLKIMFISMWLSPLMPVDLRYWAEAAELPDEEMALIEPVLSAYERTSTKKLADLVDEARTFLRQFVEGCAAEGIVHDPDTKGYNRDTIKVQVQVWQALRGDVRTVAREYSMAEAAAIHRIALLLPAFSAHKFRLGGTLHRYPQYRNNVSELLWRIRGFGIYEFALKQKDFTEEQNAAVRNTLNEFQQRWGDLWDEELAFIAELRGGMSYMALSKEELERYSTVAQTKGAKIREKQQNVRDKFAAELATIIGEETTKKMEQLVTAARAAARNKPKEDLNQILAFNSTMKDQSVLLFLPSQITQRHLDRYIQLLKYDENQKAIADSFFADYLQGLRDIRDSEIKALAKSRVQQNWNNDERKWYPPTYEALSAFESLQKRISDSLRLLNESFLSDLQMLAANDEQRAGIELVQLHYKCEQWVRYKQLQLDQWKHYSAWRTNLVDVLLDADLPAQKYNDALVSLISHMQSLVSTYEQQHREHYNIWQANWVQTIELFGLFEEGMSREDILQQPSALAYRSTIQRCINTRMQLIQLSQTILLEIAPPDDEPEIAAAITKVWLRNTFPDVYANEQKILVVFDLARQLDNLENTVPGEIEVLCESYISDSDELLREICRILTESPYQGTRPPGGGRAAWDDYQERQQAIEKLEFKLKELDSRVLASLEAILTADQWKKVKPTDGTFDTNQ